MRLDKFLASVTDLSRNDAKRAIKAAAAKARVSTTIRRTANNRSFR